MYIYAYILYICTYYIHETYIYCIHKSACKPRLTHSTSSSKLNCCSGLGWNWGVLGGQSPQIQPKPPKKICRTEFKDTKWFKHMYTKIKLAPPKKNG